MFGRALALLLVDLLLAFPGPLRAGEEPADPTEEPAEPGDPGQLADPAAEHPVEGDVPAQAPAPPGAHPKVGLLVIATTDRSLGARRAARASELLTRALASLENIEVIGVEALPEMHSGVPAEVLEQLTRADEFVRKGHESLLNLSLEEAVEAFQTARVTYRRQLAWLEDPERLIVALMGLAESLAAAGDSGAARLAYREVVGFSPDYEPDPGQVPSKLRSLFEQVRATTVQEPTGQLSVQVGPAGADVIVDGLTAGPAPLVLKHVPVGIHMLRVQRDGYGALRRVVEVQAGETAEVAGRLARLRVPELIQQLGLALAAEAGAEDPAGLAAELARRTHLAGVVLSQLVQPTGGGDPVLSVALVPAEGRPCVLAARLGQAGAEQVAGALAWQISDALDQSNPPLPPPASLGLDFTGALLGRLVPPTSVRRVAPLDGAEPQERLPGPVDVSGAAPPASSAASPLWERWWFWTGVGALVAGGVATALALTLGPGQQTVTDPDQIRIRIFRNPSP